MAILTLSVAYATDEEFLLAFDAQIAKSGLLVRGAALDGVAAMSECKVALKVAARAAVEVAARVAAVVPGVGVAVMFEGVPAPLADLARAVREGPKPQAEPEEKEAPGPLSERLKAMSGPEKMALALSGSREERFALVRDPNKMLHVYVLKNPRIGVDEVVFAAKLPTFSPDALKLISENREWSGNASVCIALVRNPKTPLPIALKLLDRLPLTEVRSLAKGGAREQIVHAARRKVNG